MKTLLRKRLAPVMAIVLAVALSMAWPRPARADETTDSAVYLLQQAVQIDRYGEYNTLLRALRQMEDPDMIPLFSDLAQARHPVLKIHGLLGLAECSKDHQIDLERLVVLGDPAVEAQLVTAAMDSNLLTLDQEQKLVDWPDLDIAVKTIVAAPLVHAGKLTKLDLLKQAMTMPAPAPSADKPQVTVAELKSKALARQSLAALLLLQMGDADAGKVLDQLNHSDDPNREGIRDMVLTTSVRYELDKVAPWAAAVSVDPAVSPGVGLTALAVAMRFGSPGSTELWQKRFDATANAADRTRLALVALRLAPWVEPKFFEPLIQCNDPLLRRMGAAGQAVAAKKDIAPAVVALIGMHHSLSNSWALGLAQDRATPEDAKTILMELILAYQTGPDDGKIQRLDDAVNATDVLVEKDSPAATALLRPLLVAKTTDPLLVQAILLGLIRASKGQPQDVVAGLPPFENQDTRALTLLLVAKHAQTLPPDQIRDLGLCVRGGGIRENTLRLQAAWTYLRLTHQINAALAQVVGKQVVDR